MTRRSLGVVDLSFGYAGKEAIFRNVTAAFDVPSSGGGLCIAIMGPSGCGKSTLLKLLMGVLQPRSGRVVRNPAAGYASFLTQDPLLFEHYGREHNARYFATLTAVADRFRERQFQELLEQLGLERALGDRGPVTEMSGGERQRLSLLRAMSVRPDFLMLDEPCTGLDKPVKRSFLTALRRLIDHEEIVATYATHHLDEAKMIADQLVFLEPCPGGRVNVHIGVMGDMLRRPPNLRIAQFLAEEHLNTLPVVFRDGSWISASSGQAVARSKSDDRLCTADPVTLAFEMTSIQWRNSPASIPVQVVARSDQMAYVAPDHLPGTWIVPAPNPGSGLRIALAGSGMIFAPDGTFVARVDLEDIDDTA
jgi:ABC-type nitrate/sulfonate/bicarbonate transport system ATPase subunit